MIMQFKNKLFCFIVPTEQREKGGGGRGTRPEILEKGQ